MLVKMLWNWKILVSHVYCASFLLFWIILGTAVAEVKGSPQGIPLSVVKLWASAFGGEIKSISAKYSGSQLLQKKYKELEKSVRVEEIDGMKVVKNLSKKMEEMFRKKKEAIRRLVEAAEEAHLQHEENPELQYEYFNAVLINEVDEEGNNVELGGEFVLEPNDHFNNLSVNLSLSVVQVPTNMYNKDPAIVNGVYWSEALNKVFVDNFEKDPSLIWQYFGSAKGFFRQYPGVKWHPDEHGVIAFDCRNRKWYIQAATSPKDVVILVDVSGSMKGLRLTIARQTVSSILDTLGDDDFFNIIAYNQEIHYVEPCLNGTLVRADRNNKAHFREHLDKLFAKGIGLLGDALTEAFTILSDFNQTGHGSVCSQAIMLVTDGATQMYDDVFAKFNWPDRKVRIFPYLIGRESAFADNMKWMACANKGYFSQISTLADVQENVMRYLHVMSRPKVIDHEHDTVWTEAYMDSTGSIILSQAHKSRNKKGPSLMTTVAMPVFSTKNETKNQGILLGVVGTDIPLQELMKIIPKHLLGIHGYAFAITNNGYILTHPDLRPLYQKGQKRRKPNYSSVDLSEVEWEDKDDFLRNAMVNRKTGTFSMEVKKTVDKGKRLLKMHNDYYYTEVKGTPFSVGVALSRGHGKFFFRGNVSVEAGLHDLEQPDVALADEWTYCNTDEYYEHRSLSQIQAIKLYLTGRKPLIKCDRELIQEVLFDAVVTAPLEAYWTGLALNKSENSDKGVEIAYLGTRTGLSRTNLFVVQEDLSNQDFLTAEDKEGVFNADHFPLWYKRAAEQVPGTFVYSIPFGGNENKSVVLASTAIQLLDDRKSPIVASVGIQMNLNFFQRKFWTASRQCAALDGKCTISCDNEDIKCYLIDNNGFILVTEDYSQTGEFFGEVEAAVMTKLLLIGSFKRINLYDYQALCREYAGSSDSGHCLSHPFSIVKWLLTELVMFLLEFNLYSWWHVDLSVKAQNSRGKTMLVPCDTEYPAFVSERTIKETTGNIDCEGCVRSFVIQQIPSSNLFMVVVDNKCDCSSTLPVSMDPIEIMYNESLKCDRLKFQKDRKRPESCHPFHPEENAMECGGAAGLSAPLTGALLPLLATLFTR
ncbi:voltage-dependent calcium channel subunit alpha-2/delta-3-like [Oncorhynchus keta]|uniref:voltage-dependent calcium channel subunit alpha-2/delta-3-like n=1 Tax=Oncorhynchus keta TaxID=8018 RepID=UPI00227CD54C|nr:voltage-dependent calcium channel subunit alpha-2/delta-3-like [Oncorhynchus keta]